MTVAEVADIMARGLPGARAWVRATGEHPVEAQALSLDPTRARLALGWQARLSGHKALGWAADWYRGFDAGANVRQLCLAQIAAYEDLL